MQENCGFLPVGMPAYQNDYAQSGAHYGIPFLPVVAQAGVGSQRNPALPGYGRRPFRIGRSAVEMVKEYLQANPGG